MHTPRLFRSLRTPRLAGPALLLVLSTAAVQPRQASAEETAPVNAALPEGALVQVHVDSLSGLSNHPLLLSLWSELGRSHQVRQATDSVELIPLREALRFVSGQLGVEPRTLLEQLTAGGVDGALLLDGQPSGLLVFSTSGDDLPERIVRLVVGLAQGHAREGEHRGVTGYSVGNVVLAAYQSKLLLASQSDLLKSAVDRLLDSPEAPPPSTPTPSTDSSWRLSARVDLRQLRDLPNVAEQLAIPAGDAGRIAFLGGWVDVFRRHDELAFDLTFGADGLSLALQFREPSSPPMPELAGYGTGTSSEGPAPLLQPPGTIYSASWRRDFGALWDARERLVTEDVREAMERQDRATAAQFEALGAPVRLSEIVGQFAPRLRVVVARLSEPPYNVPLTDRLAGAALVIELKDVDAFRQLVGPLLRGIGLVITFDQGVVTDELTYADAHLFRFSLPTTEEAVRRRSRGSYNFRTTYTITRGHAILGTTPEIVRLVIDELDRQQRDASPSNDGVTFQQVVRIPRLSEALADVKEAIIRQFVLQNGVDIETAEHEFNVARRVLRLFDHLATVSQSDAESVEYRLQIGAVVTTTNSANETNGSNGDPE